MHTQLFETLGKVAGIGGVSLGVFLLLFRQFIQRVAFPRDPELGYRLIRLFLILTFGIAAIGIAAWVYVTVGHAAPNTTEPPRRSFYSENFYLQIHMLQYGQETVFQFHGLTVKMEKARGVLNGNVYDQSVYVLGELDGNVFSGWYRKGDTLRASSPRCECTLSFLQVDVSDSGVGSAHGVAHANCRD